ncbi:HNH endonuclease [Calidithermus terrae]|uniref:HNH endonuclease n=1 Tax=Calidithermus terrae TaxID=1408545 RepID=A0A399EHY6_9DEIN|nr:HNH endonuclease [Calidithermus terrae]RIH83103.1 HNH endonuclease [Calidithermus terrae]
MEEVARRLNIDAPRVLVLNAGYQALGIASIRRAVSLVMAGMAEVVEDSGEFLRTPNALYPVPAVIRLGKMVRPRVHKVRLERRNVFKRDGYVCQYCGRPARDLTLDHVLPRSRGGPSTWDNLVAACRPCNHKKADRTPEEAGMKLLREPRRPTQALWLNILEVPREWRGYFRS